MRTFIVLLLVLIAGSVAYADVPDPAVTACDRRSPGDACSDGVCAKVKCSRARPPIGSDGKPNITEWDCVRCVPGEPLHTSRMPLFVGIGIGAVVLAGGVWFARRRGKRGA